MPAASTISKMETKMPTHSVILAGKITENGCQSVYRFMTLEVTEPYDHTVRFTVEALEDQDSNAMVAALGPFYEADQVVVTLTNRDGDLVCTTDDFSLPEPPNLVFDSHSNTIADPILTFGQYKNERLSEIPTHYLHWLANPKKARPGRFPTKPSMITPEIIEAAKMRLGVKTHKTFRTLFSGEANPARPTTYIIEEDDSGEGTVYASFKEALAYLAEKFRFDEEDEYPSTPDPEQDRILIWEVLPSGHRRVVWQFAGWHYDANEYSVGQCALPGHSKDLYSIAEEQY